MRVYKYYYCGELPKFIIDFCSKLGIDQLVNVSEEFKLDSKEPVYLYAVTDEKKKAKEFIKFRKAESFIMTTAEIESEEYEKFLDITDSIYTIDKLTLTTDTIDIHRTEKVMGTKFESLFLENPNMITRNILNYNNDFKLLKFLANSKALDKYFKKSINMIGLSAMVEELEAEKISLDELPFTRYVTEAYQLYYYLFGFTYNEEKIGGKN